MSVDIKSILTRKKVLKSNVTKLKEKIATKLNDLDISEFNLFQSKIETYTQDLKNIFQNIFSLCEEKEIDTFADEQLSIQDILDELWLDINRKFSDLKVNSNDNESNLSSLKVQSQEVKLPKLSLPLFNGNLEEWLSFFDQFKACVDNNVSLSECQKLQYLKSACKGEALKIIQSLPIVDSNYKIALDLLVERYSNTRELVNTLIRKLLNIPNVSDTPQSILNCVDIINECIRSLAILNQDITGFSEVFIVYLITQKLDGNTRSWWERTLKNEELGTLSNLLTFLKDHARTLQNSKLTTNKEVKRTSYNKVTTLLSNNNNSCLLCRESHFLYKCPKFLQFNVQKRIDLVKRQKLCFNCLSHKHFSPSCQNINKCKECGKSHHSLLHIAKFKNSNSTNTLSPHATEFQPVMHESLNHTSLFNAENSSSTTENKQTLLCTASIKILTASGQHIICRALLDTGSEASFISEHCYNLLGLKKEKSNAQITCLGSVVAPTTGEVQLNFSPHFNSPLTFSTKVYVIKKITSDIPSVSLPANIAENFNDLVLADPHFYESKPIDVLLGVNVCFNMLKGYIMKRNEILPFAVSSKLGWIISGTTTFNVNSERISVNNIQLTNELVQKFWEIDSVPEIKNKMSKVDQKCEEYFQDTHYRDETGRYVVRLPFKEDPSCLGDSKEVTLQKFLSLERRLSKSPEIYKLYSAFMQEYLELNHMEVINESEVPKHSYYIPHHHVMKESSLTTKLRCVFNASSKSSSGISLNEILMVGPRIQQELFPILLRFRFFPIVISADIMKMFRQILINPLDRDFQRIFWRKSPEEPIREYRLVTVTYGTTSAPFLATRSIYQLALDEANNFPIASKVALKDFYVDDLLSGSENIEQCKELVSQLIEMMQKGGFLLRKWASNDPRVLEGIPIDSRDSSESMKIYEESGIKVLGINWNPKRDFFHFTVSSTEEKFTFTKRDILSELAKIFDPLGWLAPCIIYIKILIQSMWKLSLSWDEPIPEEIARKWTFFRKELPLIERIKIQRFVLSPDYHSIDIHAFCDASESAYCSVIYVRSISNDSNVTVSLLTAKTRVAPLKVQSIPRLELCSAVLLTNLLQAVLNYLECPIRDIFAWSDSTVVLSWISSESYRWLPFVANRIEKIQSISPSVKWKYISGKQNPADCATRGLFPSDFINCELWLKGPEWLYQYNPGIDNASENLVINEEEFHREERKAINAAMCTMENNEIFKNYSSWSKLRRIVALCLRFIHNCRNPLEKRLKGFLTSEEVKMATTTIIKKIQETYFFEELLNLKSGKELRAHSKILPLTPFLDTVGILRVGGRLRNSNFSESQKHPILLPKKCHVTTLIIKYFHLTYLHAAQELLLSILRMKFWILSGRSEVRKIIHRCITCVKMRGKTVSQLMADLPKSRVTPSRPFTVTGIDYAGPFSIKSRSGRGFKISKGYIALFICLSTKAVHLELVSDLTTATFLAGLKRFISRRGKPSKILSDCASNFRRASKEIKELYKLVSQIEKSPEVSHFLTNEEIMWSFNPPAAPHFGGIWESNVKSVKYHLKRVIGSTLLTYEEFITLLTQIEACLNSRPLCPMSSDPNDMQVLTPGHFLTGTSLLSLPESDLTEIPQSKLKRWELVQQMLQHLWKRWNAEYLATLQQKGKWFRKNNNLKIGDLVVLKNEQLPPHTWKIGRVTQVHYGSDGLVRVVTVSTSAGNLKRPVTKLCLLPEE